MTLLGVGLNRLNYREMPRAAMLTAIFFVAGLIAFPIGPGSVHLMLSGLIGLLLGWVAMPAISVGLLMQALLFGFGGLTSLAVNAFNIGAPAVLIGLIFSPLLQKTKQPRLIFAIAAVAGGLGPLATACLVFLALRLSGDEYRVAANLIWLTYWPLIVIEAIVTAVIISFVRRVAPELLAGGHQ